jgi:hypothetical protein
MARVAGPGSGDNLATALSFDKSGDVVLRDGFLRSLEMLGKSGMDALIALGDSGVQKDTDRVVESFLGLRGREAYAALPTLLKHMHVNSSQRADLIRSAVNYQLEPPVSLDPLVAQVIGDTKETSEVKKALLEALATPGTVKGPKAGEWVLSLLTIANDELRRQAITTAGQMRLAKAGPTLLKRLGEEGSSDEEQLVIVKALGALAVKDSAAPLKALLTGEKTSEPLRREAFRALAAVDSAEALTQAKKFLTGKDEALQREAAKVLATTAEGARLLGRMYLDKKLPGSLLTLISASLRKHAATDVEAAKLLAEIAKTDKSAE